MDRLRLLAVFRRVAELQSFSRAARELRLSNAAVSKHVAMLEEQLAVRLLQRTTRKVALTATGAAYLAGCARILDELADLDQAVTHATTRVTGTLRINAPAAFGVLYLSPLLPELLAAWPELAIELSMTDRFVDLIEEGVDVVVRIAPSLPDSATLVARRLVGSAQVVCASPRYLRGRTPRTPADLAHHTCLAYGSRAPRWRFTRGKQTFDVPIDARLTVDNSLVLRDAVLADAGIALLPAFYVADLVRARRLRVVLADHAVAPVWIHAVYPRQRHLSTKIRVFVEHLRAHLARQSWAIAPDAGGVASAARGAGDRER